MVDDDAVNVKFMENVFTSSRPHREHVGKIVDDVPKQFVVFVFVDEEFKKSVND